MFRLNNTKQNVLIIALATLLTGCGGGGTATSTDSTSSDLTTTSTPKVVTVQISEPITTEDSATIEWVPFAGTATLVEYGTSKQYGSEALVQTVGTITLYNLQAGTEYHYRMVAEDQNGRKVVSRDQTFTTLEANTQPIITEPMPTDPIVTEPTPTDPIVTDPIITEPAPTDPIVTEPAQTDPVVTDPIITEPAPTDPIITEPAPICQSGPAMQQGQVKDSISGTGLANVTVTINGCITQTDAQGFYEIKNIPVNDRAVVTFELDGYYTNSGIIKIQEYSNETTLSPNYLEFALDQYVGKRTYDSSNEAIWPYLTPAKAGITIPAGVYVDNEGNTYNGQIIGSVSYKGPAESLDVFPGTYEGKNMNDVIVPFVSYGFIVIDIESENGTALNVTDDITLTFPSTSATADNIPLWYYDYAQGMWIEDGYATRLSDGTYQGFVSHPGTWSLSQPVEDASGIYTDRILYADGTPAQNLRVHAIGDNWIRTDLTTDENGVFEIEVIPGKKFTLQAYHYDDKYAAAYNGLISAVAPGDTINNSSL